MSARVGAPVSSSCWVERASSSRLLTAVWAAVSAWTAASTSSALASRTCALRRWLSSSLVVGEVAAQAGQLGADRIGLRVEKGQRSPRRSQLRVVGVVAHVALVSPGGP